MVHLRNYVWPTSDESQSARRVQEPEMEIVGEVASLGVVLRAGRQYHRHNNDRYEYHCERKLVSGRAHSQVIRLACL